MEDHRHLRGRRHAPRRGLRLPRNEAQARGVRRDGPPATRMGPRALGQGAGVAVGRGGSRTAEIRRALVAGFTVVLEDPTRQTSSHRPHGTNPRAAPTWATLRRRDVTLPPRANYAYNACSLAYVTAPFATHGPTPNRRSTRFVRAGHGLEGVVGVEGDLWSRRRWSRRGRATTRRLSLGRRPLGEARRSKKQKSAALSEAVVEELAFDLGARHFPPRAPGRSTSNSPPGQRHTYVERQECR